MMPKAAIKQETNSKNLMHKGVSITQFEQDVCHFSQNDCCFVLSPRAHSGKYSFNSSS